eukprot:g1084.t1
MGLCSSRVEIEYDRTVADNVARRSWLWEPLNISKKEAAVLFKEFYRMDKDGSRSLDFHEFAQYFLIEETAFSTRAFMVLDDDRSGELNFTKFAFAVWNFCTCDGIRGLPTFAFKLYENGTGQIPNDDAFSMIEEIYNVHYSGHAAEGNMGFNLVRNSPEYMVKQARRQISRAAGADKQMNLNEFGVFCTKHENLLRPAFTIQAKIKKELGGDAFWARLSKKRKKISSINGMKIDYWDTDAIIMAFGDKLSKNTKTSAYVEADVTAGNSSKSGTKTGKEDDIGSGSRSKKRGRSKRKKQKASSRIGKASENAVNRTLKRQDSATSIQKLVRGDQARSKHSPKHRHRRKQKDIYKI